MLIGRSAGLDVMRCALKPHPDCRPAAVEAVLADVAREDGDCLAVRFVVRGGIGSLLAPAPAEPERTDGLWKLTCFEAFVRPAGGERYVELNFSPSTQWAAYAFEGYREAMRDYGMDAPQIETVASEDVYELRAVACGLPGGAWAVGLSAVIEEADGTKSYWALEHAPGKPDFHHSDAFALELR